MKKMIAVCVMAAFCSPVWAGDVLPLPQSVHDLRPFVRQETLPPAASVSVGIPTNRVGPVAERSKDVLRLAPGKSQNIELSRDAASVIVANPAHASIFLDNPRLVVVLPRAPGATGFTVLDREGKTILSQQIVVDSADDGAYVRVTRVCSAASASGMSGDCVPLTTYYCPDNCVPVLTPEANPAAVNPANLPVSSPQADASSVSASTQSVN